MKNYKKIVLVLIAVAVILGAGFIFWQNNTLATYTDKVAGFSFEYPKTWIKADCESYEGKDCVLFHIDESIFHDVRILIKDKGEKFGREVEEKRITDIMNSGYITPPGTGGAATCYSCEPERYHANKVLVNSNNLEIYRYYFMGKHTELSINHIFNTASDKVVYISVSESDPDIKDENYASGGDYTVGSGFEEMIDSLKII